MTYHEETCLLKFLLFLGCIAKVTSGDFKSGNFTLCDSSEIQNFTGVQTTDSTFQTLIRRDHDASTNQIARIDHVTVQECVKNNCTQVCSELKCEPGQTAWYNKTWTCLDDSTFLKKQECNVNINPGNIKFHIPALQPNGTQLRPMHFLYQTKRTELWFKFDLYRCSIIASKCISTHYARRKDGDSGRYYSGWECITGLENLKKCFEFVKSGNSGKGLKFKLGCEEEQLSKYSGLLLKVPLFCTYQFGSSIINKESCLIVKISGTQTVEGKMKGLCKDNTNSTCKNTDTRDKNFRHKEEDNSQALPFLFGIILFLVVVIFVSIYLGCKKRKAKQQASGSFRRRSLSRTSSNRSSVTRSSLRRQPTGTITSVPEVYETMHSYNGSAPSSFPRRVEEHDYLEPINPPPSSMTSSHSDINYQHYDSLQNGNQPSTSDYEMLYPPKYEYPSVNNNQLPPQGYEIMLPAGED